MEDEDEFDDDDLEGDEWYEQKSAMMEEWLGKEHDSVMHAIIPYAVGGALDLYYYPNGLPGTAVATKELSDAPDEGSSNDAFSCYELVMFTRHPIHLDSAKDIGTSFGGIHSVINSMLNVLAPYSAEATLNPHDTCEFPKEMEGIGGRCLIFDGYPNYDPDQTREFGLLAVIEIFRSELEYAREHGGDQLLKLLTSKGHYPYSDMDRKPVV